MIRSNEIRFYRNISKRECPEVVDKTWSNHDTVSRLELIKVKVSDGKSNVSDRHSKVSEHKRRSSSPNLECDKTLALKSPQMYTYGEEKSSIICSS